MEFFSHKGSKFVASALAAFVALSAAASAQSDPSSRQAAAQSVRTACQADFERLCQGVQPGGRRIKECLKNHKSQLSDGCRSALAQVKQMRIRARQGD